MQDGYIQRPLEPLPDLFLLDSFGHFLLNALVKILCYIENKLEHCKK